MPAMKVLAPAQIPSAEASTSNNIPRTIWLLWFQGDEASMPYVPRIVKHSWELHNPTWRVVLLMEQNLGQYIDVQHIPRRASLQAQSDMIRLLVLANLGGVWADITMLCMRPLDEWVWGAISPQGFWMPYRVCTWFMISKPMNPLMLAWLETAVAYWQNRTEPSGNIGGVENYRWMDGLLFVLLDSVTLANQLETMQKIRCDDPCGVQPFYFQGCADEVNMPLSNQIKHCLDSGRIPPAVKLTMHARCGKPPIGSTNAAATNGHYFINKSLGFTDAPPLQDSSISVAQSLRALRRMGETIGNFSSRQYVCTPVVFGSGWGAHEVCSQPVKPPCIAISYGIDRDYSFDLNVQERTGCTVFALDPTINHPAELAPSVYFLKWGAPLLFAEVPSDGYRSAANDWVSVSPVKLAATLAPGKRIHILKMDCEGCEYALYREVVKTDPTFWGRVDQFVVEVHVGKMWLKSKAELIEYGRLLDTLLSNGFHLHGLRVDHCSPQHEAFGLLPALLESGYHDGKRGYCENMLFAKL